MATHDFPEALQPQRLEWRSVKAAAQHRSPFNGAVESVEFPGERWAVSLSMPTWNARNAKAAQAEAFFARLAGGMERLRLWHVLRPEPLGSMRGTPVLAGSVARGALELQITTPGSLRAGDLFKIGNQLFQCFADCSSSGGTLTVPLVQRVRAALTAGAAVAWDRPTALFVLPATTAAAGYSPGMASPVAVDLEEVFA